MSAQYLKFERWRCLLHEDCVRKDKLPAFDAMGDYALRLFWQRGVEPTMQGILSDQTTDKNRRPQMTNVKQFDLEIIPSSQRELCANA